MRNIKKGELFFHYGVKDKDISWLVTNAKKAATRLGTTTSVQQTPKNKVRIPCILTLILANVRYLVQASLRYKYLSKIYRNLVSTAILTPPTLTFISQRH